MADILTPKSFSNFPLEIEFPCLKNWIADLALAENSESMFLLNPYPDMDPAIQLDNY